MTKDDLLSHAPSPICVRVWVSGMCVHVCMCVWIWKKEKNLLAKREGDEKIPDKLLLHLFLCESASVSWTKFSQKGIMFLSAVKVKPYVHHISTDFKRGFALMESCDVRQTRWLHMRLQFLYLNPHVLHSLGFFPELSWVKKGKEGEAAAMPRVPSSSKTFCPQEGTVC